MWGCYSQLHSRFSRDIFASAGSESLIVSGASCFVGKYGLVKSRAHQFGESAVLLTAEHVVNYRIGVVAQSPLRDKQSNMSIHALGSK